MSYFSTTYRRRALNRFLTEVDGLYEGVVLDIGGRDRSEVDKPKERVKRWVFVDIEEKYEPDVVMDVADMSEFGDGEVDVVNAMELFEHVERIEQGLDECARVLRSGGRLILSVPFLYPVHADPFDFQRWTDQKWRHELEARGFEVERLDVTGVFFSVLGDMNKWFWRGMPRLVRYVGYLGYPVVDLLVRLDEMEVVRSHPRLGAYHNGYVIVAKKQ